MSEEMFYLSYFDFELHKPQNHKRLFLALKSSFKFIFLLSWYILVTIMSINIDKKKKNA